MVEEYHETVPYFNNPICESGRQKDNELFEAKIKG